MSSEDKEKWEEMAREDKARYLKQKEEYAGPWKVPADMKKPKDPTAPKKPTPAYFSFSNERRQQVKRDNPTASNGEISKILSKMWKDADKKMRGAYVEKEKKEREIYNNEVEEWKKERKESGRENWWEYAGTATPLVDADGNDRKRARLDLLADAAPHQHGAPDPSMGLAMDMSFLSGDGRGGAFANFASMHHGVSSSFPQQSIQDLLSSQGGLQAFSSLLPGNSSTRQQEAFGGSPNPQMLETLQQLLGGSQQPSMNHVSQSLGNSISFGSLLGTGSLPNTNPLGNQQNLLAALLGGGGGGLSNQQQPTHQEHHGGQNINDILSLLQGTRPSQQQQQQRNTEQQHQQSLLQQASFLQQGLLSQRQQPTTDTHSSTGALASLFGQQHQDQQYHPQSSQPSNASSDQLTQSLLQRLLQQQRNGIANQLMPGTNSQQQESSSSALEEAISRLVRGE